MTKPSKLGGIEMANRITNLSQRKAARIVGIAFIIMFIILRIFHLQSLSFEYPSFSAFCIPFAQRSMNGS